MSVLATDPIAEDKDQRSPFKPPNDEEVFVTRETEKAKKKEAKELLKSQKIWDKNTATSRAPLRRVKDSDISPADDLGQAEGAAAADASATKQRRGVIITGAQRNKINEALHIVRSRVQFPKESRDLNMQEFVDQKKEMFHAELAYKNVQHEIADLKAKKEERARALQKSKEDLEDDNNALMEFIALDNREKHQKEALEKQTNSKKQDKEKEIKEIDMKI